MAIKTPKPSRNSDDVVMKDSQQKQQEEEEKDEIMDSGNESDEYEGAQIRISLLPSPEIRKDSSLLIPSAGEPLAVPAELRRKGLSTIVNHLLGRTQEDDEEEEDEEDSDEDDKEGKVSKSKEKKEPLSFDFVLNQRLLRMSIDGAVRREGLSTEKSIPIYYFPASKAPQGSGKTEDMPDWVSAMSFADWTTSETNAGGVLCTGCYDGTVVALHPSSCDKLAKLRAHSGAVKCLSTSVLSPTDIMVATGSMDQTLYTHTLSKQDGNKKLKFVKHAEFGGGHTNSVESVALRPCANDQNQHDQSTTMASGDWDGGMCLWKVPPLHQNDNNDGKDQEEDHPSKKHHKKRQRTQNTNTSTSNVTSTPEVIQPSVNWKAHASNISGIVWSYNAETSSSSGAAAKLITSSWDHSCKVWDVERQDCLLTLNGSRVVSALGRCSNSDVIATGHPDCSMRLWDMRIATKNDSTSTTTNTVSDTSLKPSHKAWVSALQWSPTQPHVLATTSHDGLVKMWDVRSSLPLHSVRAHGKGYKGLCVAFGRMDGDGGEGENGKGGSGWGLFSGGSDCLVKKFTF